MHGTFIPAVTAPAPVSEEAPAPAWWFAFCGPRLLVHEDGPAAMVPAGSDLDAQGLVPVRRQYLGALDGRPCYAAELDAHAAAPAGWTFAGLRAVYSRLDDDLFALAGRAFQIVEWDRTHQFCGACATPTEQLPTERAKRCPRCGLTTFPRLSPAVIVRVTRDDTILLGRAQNFPGAFYSVLAGFVEPGESLEETVEREIQEEVGLRVCNIRYFGSQPWPFPHSLMIGFTAEYAGGEIQVQASELADAAWFTRATLPPVPPPLSIARRLIDSFLDAPPAS
jgi:NAD+ diphosphatase